MFSGFANVWTPVELSRNLKKSPMQVTVAGEKVALFRDASGAPAALIDRCPHRGVKLSLGKIKDGTIECPFHGWRFAGDGRNCHVPWNPDAKLARLGAVPVPVRERGGLLWLYTAPGVEAPHEPDVPEVLEHSGVVVTACALPWKTHWTRAMENMLDSPHLPYVHRGTIGRGMAARMRPDSRAHQELVPSDRGFELYFSMDDGERSRIDWLRPNGMELHILEKPGALLRMHAWCIPTSAGRTSMLIAAAQDFGWLNPLLFLGDFYNGRILREDKAVVESSGPEPVPSPSEEVNVPTDRPTLYFRRWYHEGRGRPLSGADEGGRRAG